MDSKLIFALAFAASAAARPSDSNLSLVFTEQVEHEGSMYRDTGLTMDDIRLVDGQLDPGKAAFVSNATRLWPKGVVPYKIDVSITPAVESIIQSAMDHITNKTGGCVEFIHRTNEVNFVNFFKGDGCWSFVGMIGGQQNISIGPAFCEAKYAVIHELGHAIGFWHEHTRWDRDNFVIIHDANIRNDSKSQFVKETKEQEKTTTYDFDSIMHYDNFSGAIDGSHPSMTAKDGSFWLPLEQKGGFSKLDTKMAKDMYCFCTLPLLPIPFPCSLLL